MADAQTGSVVNFVDNRGTHLVASVTAINEDLTLRLRVELGNGMHRNEDFVKEDQSAQETETWHWPEN